MKYKIVLNGCSGSKNYKISAEEINGFLGEHSLGEYNGEILIFYSEDETENYLSRNSPVANIKLIKIKRYQPENILEIIAQLHEDTDMYFFASDYAGSELAVRLAWRLGGDSLVSVNSFKLEKEKLSCRKSVYSNNLEAQYLLSKKPYCLAAAKGFNKPLPNLPDKTITRLDMTHIRKDEFVKEAVFTYEESRSELCNAEFVVVAGNGIKSKEKLNAVAELAKDLGAELAVSRPLAMSALAKMNQLVGISGTMMTNPKLCLALGVSGAAALYAGIKKSRFIIAVNIDENAPIVKTADVVIIDDYEQVLAELKKFLSES